MSYVIVQLKMRNGKVFFIVGDVVFLKFHDFEDVLSHGLGSALGEG